MIKKSLLWEAGNWWKCIKVKGEDDLEKELSTKERNSQDAGDQCRDERSHLTDKKLCMTDVIYTGRKQK